MPRPRGTPILYFDFKTETWIVDVAPLKKCFKLGLHTLGIRAAKKTLAEGLKVAKNEYQLDKSKKLLKGEEK